MGLGHSGAMPVFVFTTQPAPLAACIVRLLGRSRSTDAMTCHLRYELATLIAYTLFDMSYEGDYMVLDEPSPEESERVINGGLDLFRKWEGWRDDEIWIPDALEAIIQGTGKYECLPSKPIQDSA